MAFNLLAAIGNANPVGQLNQAIGGLNQIEQGKLLVQKQRMQDMQMQAQQMQLQELQKEQARKQQVVPLDMLMGPMADKYPEVAEWTKKTFAPYVKQGPDGQPVMTRGDWERATKEVKGNVNSALEMAQLAALGTNNRLSKVSDQISKMQGEIAGQPPDPAKASKLEELQKEQQALLGEYNQLNDGVRQARQAVFLNSPEGIKFASEQKLRQEIERERFAREQQQRHQDRLAQIQMQGEQARQNREAGLQMAAALRPQKEPSDSWAPAGQDASGNLMLLNRKSGEVKPANVQGGGQGEVTWKGQGGLSGGDLSPEAIDQAATLYRKTGHFPAMGMGGMQARAKILNRAAEQAKGEGQNAEALALSRASYKADAAALAFQTKMRNQIAQFESTAQKNLGIVEEQLNRAKLLGSPVFNRWVQAGRKSIAGDPEVAAYNTAMVVARNEIAKILSGSMGNQVITDQGRKEAEELMSTNFAPEQVRSVVNILRRDMNNRMKSLDDNIKDIESKIKSGPNVPRGSDAPATGGNKIGRFTVEIEGQ